MRYHVFQGLPPPDPRFSFPGAAAPGPPLSFPGAAAPGPRFISRGWRPQHLSAADPTAEATPTWTLRRSSQIRRRSGLIISADPKKICADLTQIQADPTRIRWDPSQKCLTLAQLPLKTAFFRPNSSGLHFQVSKPAAT